MTPRKTYLVLVVVVGAMMTCLHPPSRLLHFLLDVSEEKINESAAKVRKFDNEFCNSPERFPFAHTFPKIYITKKKKKLDQFYIFLFIKIF